MTNGTFSRLALLGLAAVASTAFAASTISGTIRLDAQYPNKDVVLSTATESTEYDDKSEFDVTRARVNVAGDIAPDFTYFVRLESAQGFRTTNPVSVAQAYATWHGMDNMHLNIGKTPGPFFSADEYSYKPYIVADESTGTMLGVVKERNGDHAGIDLNGSISMLSYSVGMWKASDVSAFKLDGDDDLVSYDVDSESASAGSRLRFGYGFRAALTPMDSDKMQVGVGLGFSSTPITSQVGMTGSSATSSTATATSYTYYTSFKQQTDLTVDACAVFGALQVNGAYFQQRIKNDLTEGTEVDGVLASSGNVEYMNNLLNDDAKHTGFYGEVGYLIVGDRYKYDSSKGAVSGVKLNDGQGALELVLRVASETKEDALAWMSYTGVTDGSTVYNNTSSTTGQNTENHFRLRDQSFSVNANYYVNNNTVLKAQYAIMNHEIDNFDGSYTDGSYLTSGDLLNYKKTKALSLRAEYSF